MEVHVGDAYALGSDDGRLWTIGTDAVEVVLEGRIDGLSIAGFRNKLPGQATEYVEAADPSEAFGANGTRADRQLYVRQ